MAITIDKILSQRVLSILRVDDAKKATDIITASFEAGLTTSEVTLTTPGALEVLKGIKKRFGDKITMGVGTVLSVEHVQACIDNGADFIVTPNLSITVVRESVKRKIPILPGCFTPSEMQNAYDEGASAVKLFPVSSLGAGFIKAVLAPLPHLKIIAVGGVNLENAKSYLDAGAAAIGVGTQLFATNASTGDSDEALRQKVAALIECARKK